MQEQYQRVKFQPTPEEDTFQGEYLPCSTPRAKFYERWYKTNFQREVKSLFWVRTQPAFQNTDHQYGHAIYMLLNHPIIQRIRSNPRPNDQTIFECVDKVLELHSNDDLIETMPINETNVAVLAESIQDEIIADLPAATVKAIKAKLEIIQDLLNNNQTPNLKTYKHIYKALACRTITQITATNHAMQDYQLNDVFLCKTKGCTNKHCHQHIKQKKQERIKRNIKLLLKSAKQKDQTMIMFTLVNHWDEDIPLPNQKQPNLTLNRLNEHQTAKRNFLKDQTIKDITAKHTHATTEIAFQIPNQSNLRCNPNPHTHIVTHINKHTNLLHLKQKLETIWNQHNKTKGTVKVQTIKPDESNHSHSEDEQEEIVSQRLALYLAKGTDLTADSTDPHTQAENIMTSNTIKADDYAEQQIIDMFETPKPNESTLALDHVSNYELQFMDMFKQPRLHDTYNNDKPEIEESDVLSELIKQNHELNWDMTTQELKNVEHRFEFKNGNIKPKTPKRIQKIINAMNTVLNRFHKPNVVGRGGDLELLNDKRSESQVEEG